jgi:RNA polymerase sigma factor (sigma-70 family)
MQAKDVTVEPPDSRDGLAEPFERHRSHLRGVAYRMLGSLSEAEDAVQEAWLRLARADTSAVENLRGWLTTVVARVCLDMLRSRKSRREQPVGVQLPEQPAPDGPGNPEQEAVLADSVGLALLVVLETLNPAERLAFVLHDLFAMPFEEIASIVGRSPAAVRQLASRARRRVQGQGAVTAHEAELARQRKVVEAFLAALRSADFDALIAVLDPDVEVRVVSPDGTPRDLHGAQVWAKGAIAFSRQARFVQPALIDGAVGLVMAPNGRLFRALLFGFKDGRISQVEVVADPARLAQLELAVLPA